MKTILDCYIENQGKLPMVLASTLEDCKIQLTAVSVTNRNIILFHDTNLMCWHGTTHAWRIIK